MNVEAPKAKTPEEVKAGLEKARAYVKKNDIPWMQATQESIDELRRTRFYVSAYPTSILLDREGKIVAVRVRGDGIEKQLAKLLSEEAGVTTALEDKLDELSNFRKDSSVETATVRTKKYKQ